jgi:hypothetical protein
VQTLANVDWRDTGDAQVARFRGGFTVNNFKRALATLKEFKAVCVTCLRYLVILTYFVFGFTDGLTGIKNGPSW